MQRFLHNTLRSWQQMRSALCFPARQRFDLHIANIPEYYLDNWFRFLPWQILITLAVFLAFRMYRYVWRSVSTQDVGHIMITVIAAYVLAYIVQRIAGFSEPSSVMIISPLLGLILMTGSRCAPRFITTFRYLLRSKTGSYEERIMLVGAGEAGRILALKAELEAVNAQIWGSEKK